MPSIKFYFVNFNNADYSRELLESLEHQKGRGTAFSIECILLDNSTNELDAAACAVLGDGFPWVTYVRTPRNMGYFGGLNYGMGVADPGDAAYAVICNNDLRFDNDFCSNLIEKTYDSKIFAVCPDVITTDGVHQNPHIRNTIPWTRRIQFNLYFSHYYLSRLMLILLKVLRTFKSSRRQPEGACETHLGVGACYILTPEFLKRFKKLAYPHFLYGEESYLSDQIHSNGGALWFDPDLCVQHAESASLSKIPCRAAYEFAREGYPHYREVEKKWNKLARTNRTR